jgi:hypothetical protein
MLAITDMKAPRPIQPHLEWLMVIDLKDIVTNLPVTHLQNSLLPSSALKLTQNFVGLKYYVELG